MGTERRKMKDFDLEPLYALLGKIGLCINAVASSTAYILTKLSFEPSAVNLSLLIAAAGLLLQVAVQIHAWRKRNEESALRRAKAKRDEILHNQRMAALYRSHAAMDSTWESTDEARR